MEKTRGKWNTPKNWMDESLLTEIPKIQANEMANGSRRTAQESRCEMD